MTAISLGSKGHHSPRQRQHVWRRSHLGQIHGYH